MSDPKLKEKFPQNKVYKEPARPAFDYNQFDLADLQFSSLEQKLLARSESGENYTQILYALARRSLSDVNAILEIGVGNSSLAFANALRDAARSGPQLYSVEIDKDKPVLDMVTTVCDVLDVNWHTVRGDSLKVELERVPEVVDMLYIDGDHGGEHAIGDYRKFSPLVREGGLVVFDDYPTFPGVVNGVSAIVAQLTVEGVKGTALTYNLKDGNSFYVIKK